MRGHWRAVGVYVVLFGIAIPWYWQFVPLDQGETWLGMPPWAAASVLGSLLISAYTAWLLRRPWPEEDEIAAEGQSAAEWKRSEGSAGVESPEEAS